MSANYILESAPLQGRSGHQAGRALLERMYREHFGQDLPAIGINPGGKPYFLDSPLHFSITHTKNYVFCALSSCSIGIDAEELDRPVKPSLARNILSPRELAQYEEAADPHRALLTFWVLKEAAAKETGEGIRGFPNHTDFLLTDPRVREIRGCLVAVVQGDNHAV